MTPVLENISDFKLIFESIPGCNLLVLANPPLFTVLAATHDFLDKFTKTKEQIVGQSIFKSLPSDQNSNDTEEKNLRVSLETVIATNKLHQLMVQRYNDLEKNNDFVETSWNVKNKPVANEDHKVAYIIQSFEESNSLINVTDKEIASRQIEQGYRLFSQAPVALGILKGKDFIIESANEKMLSLYSQGIEILNKPIVSIRPELATQGYLDLLNQVLTSGKAHYGYESPFVVIEDGREKTIYYNFVYQPYYEAGIARPTGVLVFANEVTDRITVKKELQESEERFRTMAEGTEIMIAVGDDSSNAIYFNKAWIDLTGRPMEALLKFGWVDLVHPDDRECCVNTYLSAFKDRKPFTGEFRILNTQGEYRWVLAKGPARFRPDGSFAGYISSCIDITESKQAAAMLQESEERIRSLVESAPFPIGVYIGRDMKIMLANQSIIDVWGKGENVIGKLYSEVLPELDNQEVFTQLKTVYDTGIAFHAKNQRIDLIFTDKFHTFYFNYSFTPLFDAGGQVYGVMNTAADVTDLNFAKQKVEESEAQFRNLVMSAPVGICIVKGIPPIVEVVNDSFLEVVGKPRELFQHAPYWDVLSEAAPLYAPILEEVSRTGLTFRGNDHEVILVRNGKNENVIINFVYDPVKEQDGTVSKVMIVVIEVTEQVMARKKIEEIVAERTRELAEANGNLRKSNDELAQFAYIASHDLQEPLRKVTTFSQLLEESLPEVSLRSRSLLDKINNSTSRMTTLIRDVLSYSQLSKENEIFEWVNLQEIVNGVESDFELLIEQKKATIITVDLPTIQGIPLQMSQLISNLISNALKFSVPEIKPVINITTRLMTKKEIAARELDTNLVYFDIEFRDNGIGFSQEHASRIFHIFQRLHGKKEYSGTGIGLAMCKKIVQNHNGDIYASSVKGQGAVFNVILPENRYEV